ncbi:MAG TPA: class I SAM-dependent methyltransferase [Dehalococcoidia bacterium]|nr:class I SAM-dependent methyltransferase [Dehalococcoidia bacterium]
MREPPAHQGWEQIWRRGGSYGDAPEPQVVELSNRLKDRGWSRVLDLGCGLGRHLLWLATEGFHVWGCDVSPTAVAACHLALTGSGLPAGVLRAEMTALPFRENVFDAVVAWDVVFHTTVKGISRTVSGVHHSLRDDGLFLLTLNSTESTDRQRARDGLALGEAEELERETYVVPSDALDKALPHHYTTEREIRTRLLPGFHILSMREYAREYEDARGQHRQVKWCVLARKR